ncbi:MAG: IS1 family transposase [Planctomycetes bacterium]|nr:IS1 family transposase [Planctomycetota bacterium]
MRKLSTEKRAAILASLVEGVSVNATSRINGVSKITVLRLLVDVGTFCGRYHDQHVRNLQTSRIEMDEVWGFCGCKEKQKQKGGLGLGDVWLWVGLDADSKLVASYRVGDRSKRTGAPFVADLASRLAGRVQITSDAHNVYLRAVAQAFNGQVDYARLVKIYAAPADGIRNYSPPECIGAKREIISGDPDPDLISTSYVERQNLTVRMGMKRLSRLTNAHSRSMRNHEAAINLHYWHYNFARKHSTVKTTPAVAAGIAPKALTLLDLVEMVERDEQFRGGRITGYLPSPPSNESRSAG